MSRTIFLIMCSITLLSASSTLAQLQRPRIAVSAEVGATRSYLVTTNQMRYLFEPTSGVKRSDKQKYGANIDLTIGKYLGFSTGMGYQHFGQSTAPTTIFLKNDIFEHDFESHAGFDYFSVPLLVKIGIRKNIFSVFLRTGVVPSVIVNNDIAWIIDGNTLESGSNRLPNVGITATDIPLYLGGEAGFHFGKNGIFLIGHYLYSNHNIAFGITGEVNVRSYGASLQYRRDIY